MALRLVTAAVAYKAAKDDKQHRRVLLSLAIEERQILEELLEQAKEKNNPLLEGEG